jgi:DNA-binding CsgD family transcriptional regulator
MIALAQESRPESGGLCGRSAAGPRFAAMSATTDELVRRRRTLGRIRAAMDRIRAQTTVADVLSRVPDEVRCACGLRLVAVYTRQGAELLPWAGDLPARDGVTVIAPGAPESEILRRGTPVLLAPGGGCELLEHPLGHVAVAVQADGRTLAVIAAAGGPRHRPDAADADALLEFAERLGWTLERLRLVQRSAAQREVLRAALDAAQRALDGPGAIGADVRLAGPAAAAPPRAAEAWGLTAREREVLSHMAEGRTNRRIGEQLFLSEGTVKCHVKRILRKLGAANRAEAVARFLGAPDPSAAAPILHPVAPRAALRLLADR